MYRTDTSRIAREARERARQRLGLFKPNGEMTPEEFREFGRVVYDEWRRQRWREDKREWRRRRAEKAARARGPDQRSSGGLSQGTNGAAPL